MNGSINLGLELHDSCLDSVDVSGQSCLIALRPAYVYEISAESGDVIGRCMSVDVIFEFDGGAVDGSLGDLPDLILDGSLSVASEAIVPFNSASTVTWKLFLWPDYREIIISARRLSIRLDGEPRLEENPPSS